VNADWERGFFGNTEDADFLFGTRMTRMTRIFLLPSAAFFRAFEILGFFIAKLPKAILKSASSAFQKNPRHPRHPRSK
jgi:hypothetical protein